MKNNKGITLIALVVTIIVLLILAGVSIAMLTGDNGIISNSQKAKSNTLEAQAKEEISMALNSIKTEVLAQVNTNSTYSPITSSSDLVKSAITGLTATNSAADNTSTTGYYIDNTTASDTITITYVNKENNFKVEGSIKFETGKFANGGTITKPAKSTL